MTRVQGRRLSGAERLYWMMDRATAVNFVIVAEMQAGPGEALLRRALDQLQRRQPMLRVQLLPHGRGGLEFAPCEQALELRVQRLPADASWLPHAEDEQLRRFELGAGPLMRCTLIDQGPRSALLLTFHHSTADANGASRVLEQLVNLLRSKSDETAEAVSAARLPPALEDELPRWIMSARGFAAFAWRFVRMWLGWFFERSIPRQVPLDAEAPLAECRDRFIPIELGEQETAALLARCKSGRYSVNAALHAAQVLAVAEELSEPSSALGVLCQVDLRRRSRATTQREMGFCIGFVPLVQRVHQRDSVAAVAAVSQRLLERQLAQQNEMLLLPWLGKLGEMTPRTDQGAAALEQRNRRISPALMTLSNVGKVHWELPAQAAEAHVTGVHFFVPLAGRAVLGSAALTFNGRLRWNFTYSDPCVSKPRAERIALRARAILVSGKA